MSAREDGERGREGGSVMKGYVMKGYVQVQVLFFLPATQTHLASRLHSGNDK